MAIINCPECNEKISDTVKQCVHCGASITVCPECKKISVGNLDICSECGYVISKNHQQSEAYEVVEKKQDKKIKNAQFAIEKWKLENPINRLYDHDVIIKLIAIGIGIWFIVTMVNDIDEWRNNMLTVNYTSVLSSINERFIFLVILSAIATLYDDFRKVFFWKSFLNWIKYKNISLKELINNSVSQNFSKMIPEEVKKQAMPIKYALDTELYDTDIVLKNNIITFGIIDFLHTLISSFMIYGFISKNLEIYMTAELWKSDLLGIAGWSFSMIEDWWIVIVVVAFGVIMSIYERSVDKKIEKTRKKWIECHMPNNAYKYEKYIENPDGYIIDKTCDNIGNAV